MRKSHSVYALFIYICVGFWMCMSCAAPVPREPPPKWTTDKDTALPTMDAFIQKQNVDKDKPNWKTSLRRPPLLGFASKRTYNWVLKTNKGTLKIRLMPKVAPMHVSSTIYLTRLGFYDSLTFHRVIPTFMAQGGDPLGIGTGGPGYLMNGEFNASVRHNRAGLLSTANAGPGTDGSQFFLTFVATPWLDGKHTIFGEVTKGMDVLKTIEKIGSSSGAPQSKVWIEKATILVE